MTKQYEMVGRSTGTRMLQFLMGLLLLFPTVRGEAQQTPAPDQGEDAVPIQDERPPSAAEIEAWKHAITMLGSPRFAEREAAAIKLVEAGPPVLPFLAEVIEHHDPEVRSRARMVHDRVAETWFEERSKRFIAGSDHEPGFSESWSFAVKTMGESTESRTWFVEIARHYPKYIAAIPESPEAYRRATEEVAEESRRLQFSNVEPKTVDVLALLLSAADARMEVTALTHRRIAELTFQSTFNEATKSAAAGGLFERLAMKWVLRAPETSNPEALQLAVTHAWPVGIERAKQVLLKKNSLEEVVWSLYALHSLGSEADIDWMQPLLEDRRELYRGPAPRRLPNARSEKNPPEEPNAMRVVQVRDMALAVALGLARVPLEQAGFPNAVGNAMSRLDPTNLEVCSFSDETDEARRKPQEALAKYLRERNP